MKKKIITAAVIAISIVTAGCGAQTSDTSSDTPVSAGAENGEASSAETEDTGSVKAESTETQAEEGTESSTAEVSAEVQAAYREVLQAYQTAWTAQDDAEKLSSESLCPLLVYYYDQADMEAGYTYQDLDGDGSEELIIAADEPEDTEGSGSCILQLYTIYNDEVVSLLTGDERIAAYVMESGDIYEIASDSATETRYYQYEVAGDYLYNVNEIAYSEAKDAADPWFLVDGENYVGIDEAEALDMISEMESTLLRFTLTPLEQ